MQQPSFVDTLARSMHEHELLEEAAAAHAAAQRQASPGGAAGQQQQRQQQPGAPEGTEVLAQDWWQLSGDGELRGECCAQLPSLPLLRLAGAVVVQPARGPPKHSRPRSRPVHWSRS